MARTAGLGRAGPTGRKRSMSARQLETCEKGRRRDLLSWVEFYRQLFLHKWKHRLIVWILFLEHSIIVAATAVRASSRSQLLFSISHWDTVGAPTKPFFGSSNWLAVVVVVSVVPVLLLLSCRECQSSGSSSGSSTVLSARPSTLLNVDSRLLVQLRDHGSVLEIRMDSDNRHDSHGNTFLRRLRAA